ncbi:hypothetical protein JCM16163A_41200 [Paenibacillus sp. YK5]
MDRAETLKRLSSIREMSDQEISINPAWIREVAIAAHMHINVLKRSVSEAKKRKKK